MGSSISYSKQIRHSKNMKFAIFALFAAGALAQNIKTPLGKAKLKNLQKVAVKQATIAQKKAISKVQEQADKAGITIDVKGTLDKLRQQHQKKLWSWLRTTRVRPSKPPVPNKPKMLTKSMSTKERVLGSLKKRLKKQPRTQSKRPQNKPKPF